MGKFICIFFSLFIAISTTYIKEVPKEKGKNVLTMDYIEDIFNCLLESQKFIELYMMLQQPSKIMNIFIKLVLEGDEVAHNCFLLYPPPDTSNEYMHKLNILG
jgi:hypothetical protein